MKKQTTPIWLDSILPLQESLTKNSVDLVEKLTKERKIDCLSITGRTKTKDGALEKIERKKYSKPQEQLTDLSGVRIIVYFESQIHEVSELVRGTFDVDDENSMDRNQVLGEDKIGYRSVHFVCTLGDDRCKLPEYPSLKGLKVEFQIRTVLQHAWAELAHDGSYKFAGTLPSNLQRKLNLYSGMLEIIDEGFDEISGEIDKYKARLETADLSILEDDEIDSINLEKFVSQFADENNIMISLNVLKRERTIVEELNEFGITKLSELSKLASKNFIRSYKKNVSRSSGVGFLRDLMMYEDIDKYFKFCWPLIKWEVTDEDGNNFLMEKYGSEKIRDINDEYSIEVEPNFIE